MCWERNICNVGEGVSFVVITGTKMILKESVSFCLFSFLTMGTTTVAKVSLFHQNVIIVSISLLCPGAETDLCSHSSTCCYLFLVVYFLVSVALISLSWAPGLAHVPLLYLEST